MAVLANELSKMVSRLFAHHDQLSRERNALADSLADVSHQIRTPLTAITPMLPVVSAPMIPASATRRARAESMIERVLVARDHAAEDREVDAGAMHVEQREWGRE